MESSRCSRRWKDTRPGEGAADGHVRITKNPWLVALSEACVERMSEETDAVGGSAAHRSDALVELHGRMKAVLECGIVGGAADAVGFVARTADDHATVERRKRGRPTVDVLHDVDFANARPVQVIATEGRAEHPERWPVASGLWPDARLGQLDGTLDAQHSRSPAGSPAASRLDRPEVQLPGGVTDGRQQQCP